MTFFSIVCEVGVGFSASFSPMALGYIFPVIKDVIFVYILTERTTVNLLLILKRKWLQQCCEEEKVSFSSIIFRQMT